MTNQKAAGEVTREHREAAVRHRHPQAFSDSLTMREHWDVEHRWIQDGDVPGSGYPITFQSLYELAQAIATAEARGRAESAAALATLQARYDTLVATRALSIAPGEELTAAEAHNAEAARLLATIPDTVMLDLNGGAEWPAFCAWLLAERAKAGR